MTLRKSLGSVAVLALMILLLALIAYRVTGNVTPLLTVKSGSMKPALMVGDVILIEPVKPEDLKVGDVVVFRNPWTGALVVHRIVRITEEGVYTKGDANPAIDPWSPIPSTSIVGRWTGIKIPYWLGVGYLSLFLSGEIYRPYGPLILVLLVAANLVLMLRDVIRSGGGSKDESCGGESSRGSDEGSQSG
ncbi:MAG: signal peptidase I [Thaumarchaeota archaeon]|nr:MAG: signal peptidase I [Nitrososphaerota archaeon]